MVDDVLINKAAIIERCLKRINEEYVGHEEMLFTDFTRQDSIILNLQRACEAAIDGGMYLVRQNKLGMPQSSRDVFDILESNGLVDGNLSHNLQKMVGFRNVAVHSYQELNLEILRSILGQHLEDFRAFAGVLIKRAQ